MAAAGAGMASAKLPGWEVYDRPATFEVATATAIPITMADGTVLRGNVYRPDAPGRFPVLLFLNPYGSNGPQHNTLGAADPYFPSRGYVNIVVDVRGTGQSQGSWDPFSRQEREDGHDLVEWAGGLPYSDGKVGLAGPSYGSIGQLLTASTRPPHLRTIFAEVPAGDLYRDIVLSGGSANTAFIPAFLATVAAGAIQPPVDVMRDPGKSLLTQLAHLAGFAGQADNLVAGPVSASDQAFDGPFWASRSPLEVVDRIDVPAFVVGGWHDIFQRSEPLIYERLRRRHVPTRLLMGPLRHLEASDLPNADLPSRNQIMLRWYDRWLKGIDTGIRRIPPVTSYAFGTKRYTAETSWPNPRIDPLRLYLRGGRRLAEDRPTATEPAQSYRQQPGSGICTLSTSQWTGGAAGDLPCTASAGTDDALGNAVYTSAPMAADTRIDGPILADVWLTTTAREAPVTARVLDVAPDGSVVELTDGWLSAGFRAFDPVKSRYVAGRLLQPWHPFTRASVLPVVPGKATELPIEVFPVNAVIRAGHRIRVALSPSDFPHQVPPLPTLAGSLGGDVRILTDAAHASYVELPRVGIACTRRPAQGRRAGRAVPAAPRPAAASLTRCPQAQRPAAGTPRPTSGRPRGTVRGCGRSRTGRRWPRASGACGRQGASDGRTP